MLKFVRKCCSSNSTYPHIMNAISNACSPNVSTNDFSVDRKRIFCSSLQFLSILSRSSRSIVSRTWSRDSFSSIVNKAVLKNFVRDLSYVPSLSLLKSLLRFLSVLKMIRYKLIFSEIQTLLLDLPIKSQIKCFNRKCPVLNEMGMVK